MKTKSKFGIAIILSFFVFPVFGQYMENVSNSFISGTSLMNFVRMNSGNETKKSEIGGKMSTNPETGEVTSVSADGMLTVTTSATGSIAICKNEDGTTTKIDIKYEADGSRKVLTTLTDAEGKVISSFTEKYNSKGNLITPK